MGCHSSKLHTSRESKYITSSNVYNNVAIAKHRKVFEQLFLTEVEIAKMYRIFRSVDKDDSGTVETLELFMALDIERTKFTERVFSIFDEDNSNQIDFREFVISMWNYCSLGKATLALFAFDLYDKDSSGAISVHEVQQMLKDVYGKNYSSNMQAKGIAMELEKVAGDEVDINEFRDFCRTHLALLFPAFNMQEILRKKVLGSEFWHYYSDMRFELSKGKYISVGEFMEIHIRKEVYDLYISRGKANKGILNAIGITGTHSKRQEKHSSSETSASVTTNTTRSNSFTFKSFMKLSKDVTAVAGTTEATSTATAPAIATATAANQKNKKAKGVSAGNQDSTSSTNGKAAVAAPLVASTLVIPAAAVDAPVIRTRRQSVTGNIDAASSSSDSRQRRSSIRSIGPVIIAPSKLDAATAATQLHHHHHTSNHDEKSNSTDSRTDNKKGRKKRNTIE